jgi:hypothetical protein
VSLPRPSWDAQLSGARHRLPIEGPDGRVDRGPPYHHRLFLFFAIYLIAIGFVVAAAFRFRNNAARTGIVITALVTTLLIALAFSMTWFCRALQQFIGVHATTASMVVLTIVMIFVLFVPLVLPDPLPAKEDDLAT